ncbi:MAG: tryptophan-rich sensory protein [Methanosarcinales archaeon]|nr:tryptophan-rich sensory protein [Methanosarcinales archaeon]
MKNFQLKDAGPLGLSVMVCLLAGFGGSLLTAASVSTWYAGLNKPGFTPPNWAFMPVWTVLFVLMGISAFLVWRSGHPRARGALALFAAQLVVNVTWSGAFFYLQSPPAGMAVVLALWVLILATMVRFRPISRAAAYLLLPYILWVSLAAAMNFGIWRLNP